MTEEKKPIGFIQYFEQSLENDKEILEELKALNIEVARLRATFERFKPTLIDVLRAELGKRT